MKFISGPSFIIVDQTKPVKWLLFQNTQLLLHKETRIPELPFDSALIKTTTQQNYLGKINDEIYCCAELPNNIKFSNDFELIPIRETHSILGEFFFALSLRALQILTWNNIHKFCTRCATPLQFKPTECAKVCPQCDWHCYLRFSVSIIVAVSRGDKILLARSPHFRPGVFSVISGFVEPGENAEETVAREVFEEVGINVTNIRYFQSQSWPFPDSFMLGFTADYANGEIIIDGKEIEAADWFDVNNMPPLPSSASISRKLIDAFITKMKPSKNINN